MKLNEQLLIKNEETYDDIKNKEIELEFSNENLSNNLNSNNNIIISKEKIKETRTFKKRNIKFRWRNIRNTI